VEPAHPLVPRAGPQRRDLDPHQERVQQERHEVLLVVDVDVQRHRRHAELARDRGHRHLVDAAVRDLRRCGDDRIAAQAAPRTTVLRRIGA